ISEVLSRLPGRVWTGGEVVGKHLLLASEQGLGDAIQFARYAQLLGEAGAKVSLACHPRLVRLLQSLPGAVDIQPIDGRLPKADLHAPLLSLPHLGGTLFEAIPAPIPYLTPEPDLVRHWTERLGEGLKIGLAWQGNPAYEGDRTRSIPLARLAPLCEASGTRFFSLQTELGRDQLDRLGHARIEDLGDELDRDHAFIDTAAVMGNLDLVITSDTAIPHLAGALGRPVWLLLPHTPDWRWGLEGTLCPWYPTMRLIRQPAPGDWRGAVDQAQAALDHWLTRGGAPNQAFDDLF
ncbi:MAG: hypothetical protein QGF09_16260, partial [Rhodospirillales bacterium]|nr:hypothetical protein [Rhodospirillales bacterium]